jgi:hypothetical protein
MQSLKPLHANSFFHGFTTEQIDIRDIKDIKNVKDVKNVIDD